METVARLWTALVRRLARPAIDAAEAEAALARDRLRDAIEAIPEGVVFLDAQGRYVLWNRRYAEIYHRSADLFAPGARLEDTLRQGLARGDYPDAAGREDAWLADRLGKLSRATGERHEQRVADGRWLMIEERRTSDGGVIGLRVDITDLKRQAAALEAALAHAEAAHRAKSDFLGDMSHELRTPLNGVAGLAQALALTELDTRQRELVDEIRASAAQLEQLVLGLLNYGDADLAPDAGAPAQLAATTPRPARGPLRILLADDNPTNRKVIELMLAATGAEVVSTADGAEATERFRRDGFDLVLMDLRMPVMDGLAAIRAIRGYERAQAVGRTPIVVLSANTSPEDRIASEQAGGDGHIGKPIRAEELFAAIERALRA